MDKRTLTTTIADRAGLTLGRVARVLHEFVRLTQETLKKGDSVALAGLGKFSVKRRAGKVIFPLRGREHIVIRAGRKVSFKPTRKLKSLLT